MERTKKIIELLHEAVRLVEVGRMDEAEAVATAAVEQIKTQEGGVTAQDSGGTNPPGPGQPGHP